MLPLFGAVPVAYIAGPDRTQAVLLPEVLDDYVGADNPVRSLGCRSGAPDTPR